jgi:hypothetical protein
MRSGITPDSSRVAEPDGQRPRYGLRKRAGHQRVSDDKSQEDASRHEALPRREGKKGKDKGTLERTKAKHGLRRLYSRKAIRGTS